mmetsp:Transcript_28750/g.80373  ORF Transcript_28750/g.80373 Transcript_28750/m.80373 type:complete len:238 (+) Transcript_28750:385-1098(+)
MSLWMRNLRQLGHRITIMNKHRPPRIGDDEVGRQACARNWITNVGVGQRCYDLCEKIRRRCPSEHDEILILFGRSRKVNLVTPLRCHPDSQEGQGVIQQVRPGLAPGIILWEEVNLLLHTVYNATLPNKEAARENCITPEQQTCPVTPHTGGIGKIVVSEIRRPALFQCSGRIVPPHDTQTFVILRLHHTGYLSVSRTDMQGANRSGFAGPDGKAYGRGKTTGHIQVVTQFQRNNVS